MMRAPWLAMNLFALLASVNFSLHAQIRSDSTVYPLPARKKMYMTPVTLIGAGLIAMTDNEIFDREEVAEERNALMPRFRTHADDYLQYAPIVAVYGLNAFGVKAQHNILNQTILLIKSELIMTAIVYPIKRFTSVPRPDTGAPTSFPSGHTAQAFAAATFIHKEYGKDHPLYSIMAFTTASGIGVLRMLNNRHWMSDVLVGAGIGIMSTNLAYLTHQNNWGNKKKKGSGTILMPTYGGGTFGVYVARKI